MTNCFIFDIDGTLSDPTHRLHHLERKDWAAFFAAMGEDPIIEPVWRLAQVVCDDHIIVLVSGRPEDYREVTERWLASCGIAYAALYMRPSGDHRPDHEVKREILAKMRADGWEPILAIDDRPRIVQMWREEGVFCLAAPWHGDDQPPVTGELHLMVGPSGGGKTTWAGQRFDPDYCINSDAMRQDLLYDRYDQTQNARVFAAIHDLATVRLRHGLPTLIDATHLRRKDRLAAAALTTGPVTYHVVDRPLEDKLRDRGWRSEELVRKHDQMFRSQAKEIMAGDGQPNVSVEDHRCTR